VGDSVPSLCDPGASRWSHVAAVLETCSACRTECGFASFQPLVKSNCSAQEELVATARGLQSNSHASLYGTEIVACATGCTVLNLTGAEQCRAWVIGLGTAFGDDRIGWEVVAGLAEVLPVGVRCDTTSDPLCVVEAPAGCGLLIVIDACIGAGPPGSVHRFLWPDARFVTVENTSSHGVGLVAALELASTLGRLPPKVVILSVECVQGESGSRLSATVEAAIPEIISRVLAEIGLFESSKTGGGR